MIRPKFYIVFLDLILAIIALVCAYLLRFLSFQSLNDLVNGGILRVAVVLLTVVFAGYFFELYEKKKILDLRCLNYRVPATFALSFVLLSAFFYVFPSQQFGRGILVISLAVFASLQYGSRQLFRRFSNRSQFAHRILIVGAGDLAGEIAGLIPEDNNPHSYVRFIRCTNKESIVADDLIVGQIEDINEIVYDYKPQKIIIALRERRGNLPLKHFMHTKLKGIEILDATTFFEQQKQCLMVEGMQPSAFIYSQGFKMTPFMRSYKRIYDIIFSSIGLLIALPVFPLLAVLIKLDSPGPVFFKQLRVGENEVEYFVYKFRTMAENAEEKTGAVWAQKNDPRVTRIGQFMRKTRIDEIPQLYNVLKGDMSFIGPRPERMAFVERLKETIPFYSTRHLVKPGVTGWAQVCYPYGASDEDALEKLRYDLYYIKNYSIFLDFRIVIDTIRVVLSGFGGR